MRLESLLFVSLGCLLIAFQQANAQRVTSLPGWNKPIPFNMYSGYITVDQSKGRNLFYIFVESQSTPSKDPLVMWVNGGPGCSSLDGFIYEHGPFHITAGSTPSNYSLYQNPYSWNLHANMLYVDAPAGVGFSYSTTHDDTFFTDDIYAEDNFRFLVAFFKQFPQFKTNPFYVTGESYGGHYVPTTAHRVMEGNKNESAGINLKGVAVGNGVTDEVFDGNAYIPMICQHALVYPELCEQIAVECNRTYWNPPTSACESLMNKAANNIGDINVYDVYEPCLPAPQFKAKTAYERAAFKVYSMKTPSPLPPYHDIVPCMDTELAYDYLNQPEVRLALHAKPLAQIGPWQICNMAINENYNPGYATMLPFYRDFIAAGMRVLIYSGDVDSAVPWVGSQAWVSSLQLPIQTSWQPWFWQRQVAGYVVTYLPNNQFTFVTVKGSGHTVPQYKPPQALQMWYNWIHNTFP